MNRKYKAVIAEAIYPVVRVASLLRNSKIERALNAGHRCAIEALRRGIAVTQGDSARRILSTFRREATRISLAETQEYANDFTRRGPKVAAFVAVALCICAGSSPALATLPLFALAYVAGRSVKRGLPMAARYTTRVIEVRTLRLSSSDDVDGAMIQAFDARRVRIATHLFVRKWLR